MDSTIFASIDAAGRIVIPKAIRRAAGLTPGTALEIRVRDGRVEIEPAARKVKIVKRGAVRVAMPMDGAELLDAALVSATQKALRGRHG